MPPANVQVVAPRMIPTASGPRGAWSDYETVRRERGIYFMAFHDDADTSLTARKATWAKMGAERERKAKEEKEIQARRDKRKKKPNFWESEMDDILPAPLNEDDYSAKLMEICNVVEGWVAEAKTKANGVERLTVIINEELKKAKPRPTGWGQQ